MKIKKKNFLIERYLCIKLTWPEKKFNEKDDKQRFKVFKIILKERWFERSCQDNKKKQNES